MIRRCCSVLPAVVMLVASIVAPVDQSVAGVEASWVESENEHGSDRDPTLNPSGISGSPPHSD